MVEYEDVPDSAKAMVILGILVKTIIDQINDPELKLQILVRGCKMGIEGFRRKCGEDTVKRIGDEVKSIWSNISDGGRIKFDLDDPYYILYLFTRTVTPGQWKEFFMSKTLDVSLTDQSLIDKYHVYSNRLAIELNKRFNMPIRDTYITVKTKSKKRLSKADVKRIRAEKEALRKKVSDERRLIIMKNNGFSRENPIIIKRNELISHIINRDISGIRTIMSEVKLNIPLDTEDNKFMTNLVMNDDVEMLEALITKDNIDSSYYIFELAVKMNSTAIIEYGIKIGIIEYD